MTAKSSPDSNLRPKLCKKACKSCGLDIYQDPVFDHIKKANVFWVGLSAVLFEEGDEKLPLSILTRTGTLVHSIETPFNNSLSFYKTNLVKRAPMAGDKVRYPLLHEMEKCYPNFEWELETLQPKTVFLLGKQVADFILKKMGVRNFSLDDNFNYHGIQINGITFIPVHHPSYILVYKRKALPEYIASLRSLIKSAATLKSKLAGKRIKRGIAA